MSGVEDEDFMLGSHRGAQDKTIIGHEASKSRMRSSLPAQDGRQRVIPRPGDIAVEVRAGRHAVVVVVVLALVAVVHRREPLLLEVGREADGRIEGGFDLLCRGRSDALSVSRADPF